MIDQIFEMRRSQLKPGTTGQHTNGPAPLWYRFNGGEWKMISKYRSDYALIRALKDMLERKEDE